MIVPAIEGTRPILVELQALTNPSLLPTPRRVASGVDYNRLLLVCAVLTRRAGISLSSQDVIVNVTGGVRVVETAADLAIALAVVSSVRDVPINPGTAVFGELGLGGGGSSCVPAGQESSGGCATGADDLCRAGRLGA